MPSQVFNGSGLSAKIQVQNQGDISLFVVGIGIDISFGFHQGLSVLLQNSVGEIVGRGKG